MDEVILTKFDSLERCIKRIETEYQACHKNIENDVLRQDAIVLNIQRACELCIDMGQRVIRQHKFGLAKEYRDVFQILFEHKIISKDMSDHLKKMVGFRNIAIHEYTEIDMTILKNIIEKRLDVLMSFARLLLKL